MNDFPRIQPLSTNVANQIAAGEVIERPASVVKELLENALDAKASHIQIDIGFGGLNQITVSDNGVGIMECDLPLAIAPHATSKLQTLNDLNTIHTMGFRGEALASIASVSRFSIQSRPAFQTHAMKLEWHENGATLSPCARAPGTTVDVRDLFFNTPVRKTFLKTQAIEFLAIEMVVKRFAFSEPGIALTLTHNGKTRLALPSAPCEQTQTLRLRKLLGKAFFDQAHVIDVQHGELSLTGWVSGIGYARSQQDKQWVYINRRMVRDKLILHAIKLAYEPLLHPGRFPACLLYLTLPPQGVDVNVHPTKHEVRFHDPRAIHHLIQTSLMHVLVDDESYTLKKPVTSTTPHRGIAGSWTQTSQPSSQWIHLNQRFVILYHNNTPYLVDMLRVREKSQWSQLASQPLPWRERPLLMPIAIELDTANMPLLLMKRDALAQLGFMFHPTGPNTISISAIPCDFPGLNLHAFIQYLTVHQLDNHDLIQALMLFDTWDLSSITSEEKEHWMTYWLPDCPFSLRLDEKRCQELMNV